MTNALPVTEAIVYHSGFGHTRVMAEAVRDGAAAIDGTEALLIVVDDIETSWADLVRADTVIFGTPTYMVGPSAAFKSFMDAYSERWSRQACQDKLAAGFTNSAGANGDKLNTLGSLSLFAMQHGMVWVGLGLLPAT